MSGCSIDIDIDDGICEMHTVKYPIARTQHVCNECGGEIRPGDKYEYVFGVWDGRPNTQKTCRTCQIIRDKILCTWYYGEVWSHLQDELHDGTVIMCAIDALDDTDPDESKARQALIDWVDSQWFD